MRNKKNKLDEMQEQKLLCLEHNGAWLAFWGLLAAMIVQLMIYGFEGGIERLAGEWVVFMCLAIYIGVGSIRIGVWDRKLEANAKTNFLISFVTSIVFAVILALVNYRSYQAVEAAIATFVINVIVLLVVCFVGLTIASNIYKSRLKKLEQEEEE